MSIKHRLKCGAALTAFALPFVATAQKKYDPGASDTEIKLGQTMPYSGPASAYGFAPIKAVRLGRFDGKSWVPFGDVLCQ